MSKLYMLVGLPASGKSTLAEKLKVEKDAIVISSDVLREELLGNVNDQNSNVDVFTEMYKRANELLTDGKNVIMDSTNINRKRRMHVIKNEVKADEYHVYYMNTHFLLCCKDDKLRERTVGYEVLDKMYKNIHIPTKLEGWDTVTFIGNHKIYPRYKLGFKKSLYMESHDELFKELSNVVIEFKDIIDVSQDSSYHPFSISRHIFYVHQYILENYKGKRKEEMLIAALFHDVGKGHCKSFINHKGEKKRYASFLGHENVSSQTACYVLTGLGYDYEFVKYIVDLIQFHMMPMNMSNKVEKRLKKLLTEEQFEDLMFLHEADLSAK